MNKSKIFLGNKKPEFYKGLLICADLYLHEQIAKEIMRVVPVGGEVLDLGSGEGALAARLSDLGYRVTAADKDREKFKCKDVDFTCINFDSPTEINNFVQSHLSKFDIVMGVEVIEHVQDQWGYVRQLFEMAKPNGFVLITTPNITSWLSRIQFFFTGRFHQFSDDDVWYGHVSPVSPWELDLILKANEAVDIKFTAAGTLPPIYWTGFNKMSILNLLILVLRPFMRGLLDGWCVMATARKKP